MASDFENALAAVRQIKEDASANLTRLADAVRANPDDADLKAQYNEAKEAVSQYREFERGGNPGTPGNLIGGIRGVAGDITVTRDPED